MTAYKLYPNVENEILNIHGLNNKLSFWTDFRAAFANQSLNSIAVQDDLDDNEYEFVRRYFAITNWTGGILPGPYDPRALILRRASHRSPARPTSSPRSPRSSSGFTSGCKPSAVPRASGESSTG